MRFMAFIKRKTETTNFKTPQEMYSDYKNRKIKGIINYQSEVIDNYMSEGYNDENVALELPTGSGKTLIGLVIGEFRRRKNKEKVVYLCPNKQLVNQVVEQATSKYGIKTIALTGKQKYYDPIESSKYIRAECIAITTYSALFNNNSFFKNADIIIFDDAHSAEDFIASNWSVEIKNDNDNHILFSMLVESLKDILEPSTYCKMAEDYYIEDQIEWCDKIPNTKILEKIEELKTIIDENISGNNKYSWANIRDKLHICNFYINSYTIVIRPYIPPTLTNPGFKNAKQRIYMSATLGISGELERAIGISEIKKLAMVNGWDKKAMGRRFFIFPSASIRDEDMNELLIKMVNYVDRTLILVKNDSKVKELTEFFQKETQNTVFLSKDIEKTKENFTMSPHGIAILANRYDGIDLAEEECRLLIIYNVPKSIGLQEQFITKRMASSVLFNERIKTRLIQAIGRCTRNDIDYSAVCIIGQDIINELFSMNKVNEFNPELQAEIQCGYSQYETYKTPDDIIENLNIFLSQDDEWESVNQGIVQDRDELIKSNYGNEKNESLVSLMESAKYEVKYQYAIWREDYEKALGYIENILNCLKESELKGYRGFWYYTAGCVSYILFKQGKKSYKDMANKYFNNAAACSDSITWFRKLISKDNLSHNEETNDYSADAIERIEEEIYKYGTTSNVKFERQISKIMNLLNDKGIKFEQGYEMLGNLLGYIASNSSEDGAPDPWWIINENICIVCEMKIYESCEKAIPLKDIREARTHADWIRQKVKMLKEDAEIITIFITNSNSIEPSAAKYADSLYYVNKDKLLDWSMHAVAAIRNIRRSFSRKGNLIWRGEAIEMLKKEEITPLDFLEFISNERMDNLGIK
ncbi:hypothetical protein DIC82_16585 [Clostridium beijerinckii]|nr:hypothetical protein DIC82_16585 [Clostridium beijerinckii]